MKKQVIGITGGIGCGKSVVMSILEKEYHAYVLLSDLVGHELMKPGAINYVGIVEAFGRDILLENEEIDRKKLGSIVFGNPEKLALLNSITHPNIMTEIKTRVDDAMVNPEYDMVCLESALLFETELASYCNQTWYVYAEEEVRIERLIAGRGYTREYCEMVMAKQKGSEIYRKQADVIIDNSKDVEITKEQIANLMK